MVTDGTASRTARMVAAYRARASERPEPVCSDPWARQLAGPEGFAWASGFEAHFPHMELWLAVRTEFLDREVQAAAARGVAQVVLLGAGFDTRAARLAAPGRRFFEVDHPATQADKRARLGELAGYPAGAARFVACDFEAGDDFVDRLGSAGWRADLPSVVVWEGVTPYLSEVAVLATARRVALGFHPSSLLVFDYLGKRMATGDRLRERDHGARDEVGAMGEPIRWGTDDPLPLLYEAGFRDVRTVRFDEACLSLTGTYDRAREFRFQGLALARREAPAAP